MSCEEDAAFLTWKCLRFLKYVENMDVAKEESKDDEYRYWSFSYSFEASSVFHHLSNDNIIVVKSPLDNSVVSFYFNVLEAIYEDDFYNLYDSIEKFINRKLDKPYNFDKIKAKLLSFSTKDEEVDLMTESIDEMGLYTGEYTLHSIRPPIYFNMWTEDKKYERHLAKTYTVGKILKIFLKRYWYYIKRFSARRIQRWFKRTQFGYKKRVKLQMALVVQNWYENPDNPVLTKMRTRAFTSLYREILEKC
jgi:hypothetical protein